MGEQHLPATSFAAAQDRSKIERNTIIEDVPQISIRRAPPGPPAAKQGIISPVSEDFPTPRAIPQTPDAIFALSSTDDHTRSTSPNSSDTRSELSSIWSKRSSNTSFDSLYDVSSDECEHSPVDLATSAKKRNGRKVNHPLTIQPSAKWHKPTQTSALSPLHTLQLSPAVLKHMHSRSLAVPGASSAPSLDGSLTSEELASASCPPTPDMRQQDEDVWSTNDKPLQLDPFAFSLLQQISGEPEHHQETVIELSDKDAQEMREVVESPGRFGGLQIQTSSFDAASTSNEEVSALSVPSPSHFFSSLARQFEPGKKDLDVSAATDISRSSLSQFQDIEKPLATSIAKSFYDLPLHMRPDNPIEHIVTVATPGSTDDPPTARRAISQPVKDANDVDEKYERILAITASASLDRTQLWLSNQDAYLQDILLDDGLELVIDSFKDVDGASPLSPEHSDSPDSKKSVRFAEFEVALEIEPEDHDVAKRVSLIHDGTFWEAFCHTKRSQRARDVFQHRQMRAEAEQVRRNSSSKTHAEQLKGRFELVSQVSDVEADPSLVKNEQKGLVATIERERQALDQMQASQWHVEAQKELNGGTLLTSPVVATFRQREDVNILDLAGQAHCSWAWDVAVTHPKAVVYTTVATDVEAHVAQSSLEGPNNHQVVAAPKLWDLPFDDGNFDIISARNLYMHLRGQNAGKGAADEWDLTLQECMRVLKPGGYLEYDLLEAELSHPEATGQALGAEFANNLKAHGYDPCSGKNFLPRLKRAGFGNIKRAWMVLPVANSAPRWTDGGKHPVQLTTPVTGASNASSAGLQTPESYRPPLTGSTHDVRAITGLVGARAWEQWMLKMNSELGHSEAQCLETVSKALTESGKVNAGWKCLVGWAQKAL